MKYLLCTILFAYSFSALAESLTKGEVYRTNVHLEVGDSIASPAGIKVGASSKFIVIDDQNKEVYAIKFRKIYQYSVPKASPTKNNYKAWSASGVVEDKIYYIRKKVGDQNEIALADTVVKSFSGITSGPLIVPFKYRLNDKSISGEAMIGYYAGIGFDVGTSEYNVAVTPFLSAGISQVGVNSTASDGSIQTDSKTGFTWSTGFLIQNWDSVNIGIVYGQDRIGDSSWEHEGEGWFSISVGWEL